ncbi:MAG: hypothetical protein K8R21_06730 [Leptospira sp.]|nr:hypothetical protein [Leptospira sp.]
MKLKLFVPTEKRNRIFLNIISYEIKENFRNRWFFTYVFAFAFFSSLILYIGSGQGQRSISSLLNEVLLLTPLFGILYGSISFLETMNFIDMILYRDVSRNVYFFAKWLGMALSLGAGISAGIGIPFFIFTLPDLSMVFIFLELLLFAILLNVIFMTIGINIALLVKKKEIVISVVLFFWFYFYLLYDLLITGLGLLFGEYPVDIPVFILIALNPVDLVRISVLLQMDLAVLLGFSAAFFQKLLGGTGGALLSVAILISWVIGTFYMGYKIFSKKDL